VTTRVTALLVLAVRVRDARAQESALLQVDPRQEAYERADMAKHALTAHVGVGYPELPRVGLDYLATPDLSVTATVGAFLLLPNASLQVNVFLVENLGFRPFVAPAALAYLRPEAGDLAVCPALRVGFENRGVGGDWFRAEIGAAYNSGPLPLPVIPIVSVARGFSPVP
jgi:hypothetical protein